MVEGSVFATCAVKALLLCDNKFLVLSKPRWARESGIVWNDLPGGRIDHGEFLPRDALSRELREEVGLRNVAVDKPIHMGTVVLGSDIHVVATIFLCRTQSKDIVLSEEHVDYRWVDLTDVDIELPAWIRDALAEVHT